MQSERPITPSTLSVKDLPWQILWDKEKCTLCGKCTAVCPVNAIELGVFRKRTVKPPIGFMESPTSVYKAYYGIRQKTDWSRRENSAVTDAPSRDISGSSQGPRPRARTAKQITITAEGLVWPHMVRHSRLYLDIGGRDCVQRALFLTKEKCRLLLPGACEPRLTHANG